ncbi:SpoVR family protein [Desulfovirgula thermocuniculi]|uniref:SpoVR family protein n=1 Tax=Desulfovirgula thermocuniculi TaxID=348842 RepID=UPI00041400B5|nr:SpoVR family protein [Desulfovirgula thermocuniculi]
MARDELRQLEEAVKEIMAKARECGLDFYDMYFEIVPAEIIYTFGAYGMPTRFSHWTFGKAYHKMKTQYDYNLMRIYEMVINTDPCYAFLLEGNSLIQNKLVIAHVLAHSDFFKNNVYFRHTSRQMVESMASAAERFRGYELKYGREAVESFLDAVISIQEHVDPYRYIKAAREKRHGGEEGPCRCSHRETPYDDLWELDRPACAGQCRKPRKFPAEPEKDLLLFIMEYARDLEDWQRDVISVIRQEMLYFWPQLETKIMNEGWATYWHLRIMRELDLNEAEAVEFAKMHAEIIQPSRLRLNPYLLGLKIFEDIERRWDNPSEEERRKFGRKGQEGRKKIFEVREQENDVSFLRNYLTRELVEEMDLYLYKKMGHEWRVTDKDWEAVRDGIVAGLVNGGFPYIVVDDGDYQKRGELYLRHCYEGMELDVYYLERTLPYVYTLWGRPVHLETVLDGKKVLFTFNGERVTRKVI